MSCWSAAVTISVLPLSVRNRSRAGFLLSVVIFGRVPSGFPRGSVQIYSGGAVFRWRGDAKGCEHAAGYNSIWDSSLALVMFPCHSYSTSVWKGRVQMQLWRTGLRTSMHGCQRIFDSCIFKPLPLIQTALGAIIENGIARDRKSRPRNSNEEELHFFKLYTSIFPVVYLG